MSTINKTSEKRQPEKQHPETAKKPAFDENIADKSEAEVKEEMADKMSEHAGAGAGNRGKRD